VCIEESFDTIFNMDYGSRKSAMDVRVKKISETEQRGKNGMYLPRKNSSVHQQQDCKNG